ncbi:hypothetical protein ACIU1J_32255 [Azospirillum doebereinerae]|uniref:hypothetical protein n=1 Tax=Azospirillum doebereinerae TaxID=92933 RepID=UPI001EE52911|nr:hypothetical protein [Azospirillum doebereinerae]MCG5238385.1 hypothetical protein [Azospirillum doebereinerae]
MSFNTFAVSSLPGFARLPADVSGAVAALSARLESKGVSLFISDDWSALEAINARHANSWFPLLPHPASAPTLWVGAADQGGDVVASYGGVLLDCGRQSLGEKLGDLTVFHDAGDAPAEEWCFCASEAAFDTRGRVTWMTAGWTNPAWRGRGLFHPLGHLLRFVSWAAWDVHWWAGVVEEETVPVWNAPGAGRRRLEARPAVLYQQSGVDRCALHLCRFSRAAVTLDAGGILDRLRKAA